MEDKKFTLEGKQFTVEDFNSKKYNVFTRGGDRVYITEINDDASDKFEAIVGRVKSRTGSVRTWSILGRKHENTLSTSDLVLLPLNEIVTVAVSTGKAGLTAYITKGIKKCKKDLTMHGNILVEIDYRTNKIISASLAV